MILHLVEAGSGTVVYMDAKEEYREPDQARRTATKLLELAQRAERPATDPAWP